ncbi:PIN domain-containing protein [Pseudofrankia sp. DC12]|uniref:PIN domain-containing protein n=1 Tax=Pseudofrankia sp. DC12 TaxID=683315 RepID=UPI0005F7FF6F|nr:PIN domain-containing protein [Pseudofrankia sp. DC12]
MARRVILDTGVLIAVERGTLDVDTLLGLDDAVIAAVTAMELLVGAERADEARRQARAVRVEAILSSLPIEPYTLGVARVHARLTVAAMASGRPRSAHDMAIAATAAATSRVLLTTDANAGFGELAGVRSEVVQLTGR